MRWVFFGILVWLGTVAQTTVVGVLGIESDSVGTIAPDLLVGLTVFVALYARRSADALIAALVLGFAADLTTASAGGVPTVIGPMAIAYALMAKALLAVREAMFRDRVSARVLVTLLFCLCSHALWITMQCILNLEFASWSHYASLLLQAVCVSVYSAIVAPLVMWLLAKRRGWIFAAPAGRLPRLRRGAAR